MKTKIIGKNYLHTHPMLEKKLNVNNKHCIVDKEELYELYSFFNNNPEFISKINKENLKQHKALAKPTYLKVSKKTNWFKKLFCRHSWETIKRTKVFKDCGLYQYVTFLKCEKCNKKKTVWPDIYM
jgi:hypothetical protein